MKSIWWTILTLNAIGVVGWVIYAIVLLFLVGCATPQPIIPDLDPTQTLTKVVFQTNWIATVSIVGIAISAFTFLNGNKTGIAGMVACFVALTMTLAVARYAQWLAIGGLVGSVGLMVYSIFTKDRALKEVVQGGQKFKLCEKGQKNLFNEAQAYVQNPQTTKLVKKIKKGLDDAVHKS